MLNTNQQAQRDLEFLKELQATMIKWRDNNDWPSKEHAFKMVEDWMDELTGIMTSGAALQPKTTLRECKEQWAAQYGKTWEDVQHDFEIGAGVNKLYSFEEVMDMVAAMYNGVSAANTIDEVNLLRIGFTKQFSGFTHCFYSLDVGISFLFTVDSKTMTLSIQLRGYGHIRKLPHIKTIEQIAGLFSALTGKPLTKKEA